MPKNDDISSTEKLLELIRGNRDTESDTCDPAVLPAQDQETKALLRRWLPFGRKMVVGVDIDHNELRLVKIRRLASQKTQLLGRRKVDFQRGVSRNDPDFQQFLRKELTSFCGSAQKIEIWSAVPSANFDTRYLKIPKVPRHQIANAVYWTYQKEVPFNDQEVVFDYEILGDFHEGGVQKIEVMAYSTPRKEVEFLRRLFEKSGFPLAGITIFPFVFRNFLKNKYIDPVEHEVCSLCIGTDWSSIDLFSNGRLMLSRGIRFGLNSMVEAVRDSKHLSPDAAFRFSEEENDIPSMYEKNETLSPEGARSRLFGFIRNDSRVRKGQDTAGDFDQILAIIQPVLERLVRQVERTLKHYTLNFKKKGIGRVYLSGELCACPPLVNYIGEQLDLPVGAVDPFAGMAADSGQNRDSAVCSEESTFAAAMGLALCANAHTPNFILTYQDKAQMERTHYTNRRVVGVFVALMAVCGAIYGIQERLIGGKQARKALLQQQLAAYRPIVDQDLILQQAAQIKDKQKILAASGKRYLAMAVIGELSHLTPPDVRLVRMTAELAQVSSEPGKGSAGKMVMLDGMVTGDRQSFDTILASYMIKLKSSPLFGIFIIKSRSLEIHEGREVLRFTGHLELVSTQSI